MELQQTPAMELQYSVLQKIDIVIGHRKELLAANNLVSELDLKSKESLSVIVENMMHLVPRELELVLHHKIRSLEEILIFLIDQRLNGTDKEVSFTVKAFQIYGFNSWVNAIASLELLKPAWNGILNVEIVQLDEMLRVILTLPEKA